MRFTLDKGWQAFSRAIEPKFIGPIMEKHVGLATKRNGLYLRTEIRNNIRAGLNPKNAELTYYIKGGNKPIVGTKGTDLFNSITSNPLSWHTVEIGVLRKDKLANVARIVHEGLSLKVTARMRQMFWLLWLTELGKFDPALLYGRAKELWDLVQGRRKAQAAKKAKAKATKASATQKKPSVRKKGKSGKGTGGKSTERPPPPGGFKPISLSTSAIIIPPRPFIKMVVERETVKRAISATWVLALKNTMNEQTKKGRGV